MRDVWVPLLVGAGAGVLVGYVGWRVARQRLDQGFAQGAEALAVEMGVGAETLQQRLAEGRRQLRAQLAQQIEQQIPPAVESGIESAFAQYGLTKAQIQQLGALLERADDLGWV